MSTKLAINVHNKAIADYMGLKLRDGNNDTKYRKYSLKDCKYHNDWEWLMKVIKKIEKTGETKDTYGTLVEICTTHTRIGTDVLIDHKLYPTFKNKIEPVYLAVIQYIYKQK